MTYILGINCLGINSIVSDSRVTSPTGDGWNTSLKTGFFFPGCVFGRAGNMAASRDFIIAAKVALNRINTLSDLWSQFEDFVTFYDMPVAESDAGGRFSLLLSSRCRGDPEFFKLDSRVRQLVPIHSSWISLGSGKTLLDPLIEMDYISRIDQITKIIRAQGLPNHIYPYFICLWLSELALTFEKTILEERGVGGVFHFIVQSNQDEAVQGPALYVFSDANNANRQITCWFYRVCFVEGCLIVEEVIPPNQLPNAPEGKHKRSAYCNEASRPDILEQFADDPTFKERMRKQLNGLPFYQFCGFGFTNPEYRRGFGFHFTNEGKYVVTPDGQISDEYKAYIASNFQQA